MKKESKKLLLFPKKFVPYSHYSFLFSMNSTKYTLSLLLGLLLVLPSCSLLEKKSAPETPTEKQEDTQTENQENTPEPEPETEK